MTWISFDLTSVLQERAPNGLRVLSPGGLFLHSSLKCPRGPNSNAQLF